MKKQALILDPTISRYDRSIADNLEDLRVTFGESYEIVFNFLQFLNNNLRFNMFGYSSFTLKEFAKERNIRYQKLSERHPDIRNGLVKAPEISGYKFESYFDYSLFLMYSKKIMFSRDYSYRDAGKTIHLSSLSLLSDIKLNFDWTNGTLKFYDVKASLDLIEGNYIRYYTLDADAERALGKGKNSLKAKEMLWWLCRTRHIIAAENSTSGIYAIDLMAKYVNINTKTAKAKKQAVGRLLNRIKERTNFPFDFSFSNSPTENGKNIKYYVILNFYNFDINGLSIEHRFMRILFETMMSLYQFYEKDRIKSFSEWLTDEKSNLDSKVKGVISSYEKTYNTALSSKEALMIIRQGILSKNSKAVE
jgi:hypothetical protein